MSFHNSKDFRKTEFEANSDTKQPFFFIFSNINLAVSDIDTACMIFLL